MSGSCNLDGCTVDETGKCALERNPDECSNRARMAPTAATVPMGVTLKASASSGSVAELGAPVLSSVEKQPVFPPSTTLGASVIEEMMLSRYVTAVGILGEPESGKTACLVSLYLLVSNGMLEGWRFADSSSLMGFEDISRGAREWNEGRPPQQLTLRTETADERQAGFLHLRLRRRSDGRRVDFALPDLPGEWTNALVKSSRTDRFEFLKAADTVWLVVDGNALRDREQRQGTIVRLGQLAGRVGALTEKSKPRMLIIVSYRDMGELPQSIRDRITNELTKHDVRAEIVEVAPFSDDEDVCKGGHGIEALINATVGAAPQTPPFWESTQPAVGGRAFLAYRRDR